MIAHIIGNRPHFIKLASILRVSNTPSTIIHTGQHYSPELSSLFFSDLKLPEPINLHVGSGSHAYQTANILIKLEKYLVELSPSLVVVYGDTNSTLAATLCACKLEIPVAHVESGCRNYPPSYSPENTNRIITDHISYLLFAPTSHAYSNLLREGIAESSIYLTGDVTYDSYLHILPKIREEHEILRDLDLLPNNYILITAHRPELVDSHDNLRTLISAILYLTPPYDNGTHKTVFPIHPRTLKQLKNFKLLGTLKHNPNIIITESLGYLPFLSLLYNSKLVLTDSGGVFKEALYSRKPVVNLCSSFPYPEIFSSGRSILTGPYKNKIIKSVKRFLSYKPPPLDDHFGDGHASDRIVKIIEQND